MQTKKKELKKIGSKSKRKKIDIDMPLSELIELYPELAEILTNEYGLHCVNCMISDFDTLEQGALIHGIEGEFFLEMVSRLEDVINDNDISN